MNLYHPIKFGQALTSSALVLLVGLIAWLITGNELSVLGKAGWLTLPAGVLVGALLYALVLWFTKALWVHVPAMQTLMVMLSAMFRNFNWPAIIVISIMAGLSEELLLRGVIQTVLIDVLNPFLGILLASLIFGLMHFLMKIYVIVTFVVGLLFGLTYYLTDSLALVIIAHATYDVFAFAILVKYPHVLGIEKHAYPH